MAFQKKLIVFLFILYGFVFAYTKDLRFEDLSQSIPVAVTYSIFQDSLGFLWFGSAGEGLIRYDGVSSRIFPEVKGNVYDICEQFSEEGLCYGWLHTAMVYASLIWSRNVSHIIKTTPHVRTV